MKKNGPMGGGGESAHPKLYYIDPPLDTTTFYEGGKGFTVKAEKNWPNCHLRNQWHLKADF